MSSAANPQRSQQPPYQQRGRRRHMSGGESAQAWEGRWRQGVDETQETHTKQLQDVSLILERTIGRLDEHDRRIKALEERPARAQAWFSTANSGLGTLISIGALLIALLSILLSHITFH